MSVDMTQKSKKELRSFSQAFSVGRSLKQITICEIH